MLPGEFTDNQHFSDYWYQIIKCLWGSKMYNKFVYKVERNENATFNVCFLAEKPALDPDTVKMWTLSASDMNDDDVVSTVF